MNTLKNNTPTMEKPFEYYVFDLKTKTVLYRTNIPPLSYDLETWGPTDKPGVFKRTKTREAYIDTRYKARLRLYNYLNFTSLGLPVPAYRPYADLPKDTPILNTLQWKK